MGQISPPYRADSVAYWAVQGGAGWLNVLRQLQSQGLHFPEQCIMDLRVLRAVLTNVILVNDGLSPLPLPGGASGPTAKHFAT